MSGLIPHFSALSVDDRLTSISARKSLRAIEIRKEDPGTYDGMMEGLERKEKEIRDADTWYYKTFRSIAWGPTIVLNVLIALLWS